MTKDNLPTLPYDAMSDLMIDYARAAIAAHDAKREKVLMRKHRMTGMWDEEKFPSSMRSSAYSYHWAYIEREGA